MIACPANRLFLLKTWSHPLIIQGLILCLLCILILFCHYSLEQTGKDRQMNKRCSKDGTESSVAALKGRWVGSEI